MPDCIYKLYTSGVYSLSPSLKVAQQWHFTGPFLGEHTAPLVAHTAHTLIGARHTSAHSHLCPFVPATFRDSLVLAGGRATLTLTPAGT